MSTKAELESKAEREAKTEHYGGKGVQESHGFLDIWVWALPAGGDIGVLLLLLILIIPVGIVLVGYAIAFILTNLLSLGQVAAARKYCKKINKYSLEEPKGSKLAGSLVKTNSFFTIVILALGIEEGIRYILNTGPATVEVWAFRFGCVILFTLITSVFFVRLHRWLSFRSTTEFTRVAREISEYERRPAKEMYSK